MLAKANIFTYAKGDDHGSETYSHSIVSLFIGIMSRLLNYSILASFPATYDDDAFLIATTIQVHTFRSKEEHPPSDHDS